MLFFLLIVLLQIERYTEYITHTSHAYNARLSRRCYRLTEVRADLSLTAPLALDCPPIALPHHHHHHLVPTVLLVGMSTVSPPPYINGYASPAPYVAAGSPPPASKPSAHPKPKPVNVFSNDGSFLERFQHIKKVGMSLLLSQTAI